MDYRVRFTVEQIADLITRAALADNRLPKGEYSAIVHINTDPPARNIEVTHVDVILTLDTPAEEKNHNVH